MRIAITIPSGVMPPGVVGSEPLENQRPSDCSTGSRPRPPRRGRVGPRAGQVRRHDLLHGGGVIACFLRQGDRFFLTYETTGRGVEAIMSSHKLLDLTVYGRQEVWEDSPAGWPQEPACSRWRRDGRPVPQWTRRGVTPVGAAPGPHCHRAARRAHGGSGSRAATQAGGTPVLPGRSPIPV
ncbi:DUF899 family protein [Asanoa siamensis]|uniref:DUF899 family protein n=1 Tax=Asanoa siamensis TaxID=926357 RepID=UPI001EF2F24A|nr:DUF899 family protein [Asanoa siamensis]